jgi:hypothetical protein
MSSVLRSTSLGALVALTLVSTGCGSGDSTNSGQAGGLQGNAQVNAQGVVQLSVQETVLASVGQASLAQALGGLLTMARHMAPIATGFRAFQPDLEVSLPGDYVLTRTQLADGRFRLDVYTQDKARQLASAIASPAVQDATGYTVDVGLGDPRVRERAPSQLTQQTWPFFGFVGQAQLRFDNDGRLVSLRLIDVERFGFSQSIGKLNGTLGQDGDHMRGSLTLEGRNYATVDALFGPLGRFDGLALATEFFGAQGRALLNRNFNSVGLFSPLDDPLISSPLVSTPLPNPPAFSLTGPNNNRYVSYTVIDGIFTVTTPPLPPSTQPGVQSFDLLNAEPLNGAFPPISLPAGSRLIVQAGPPSPVPVGTPVTISVYAVNSSGKAVPFNTNGFQLTSSNPQVARVGDGFQVTAVAAGSTTLTLTDPASGQSGTVQLTVQGAGAISTGFVYISEFTNGRIVRLRYNPASPAVPTDLTSIPTGHSPLRILISRDKQTLMAENSDNTLQVFSINQSTGDLTERSADTLRVTGLAQGQLDPELFYGNSSAGSPNQVAEFRFNSGNGRLTFVRNLRAGASSRLVTGLIAANQIVFGSFQNSIHSIDVATATSRDVTMGAGETVSDLAVTRLASGANTLQVLLRRNVGGGVFVGELRSFLLNNDGTLNTGSSRNIAAQNDAFALAVNNDRAYTGAFANSAVVNGVQLTSTALTPLPGQPYGVSGNPSRLATQGNVLFVGTSPESKLETLVIGGDGSLTNLGAVDVGGSLRNIEVVVLP